MAMDMSPEAEQWACPVCLDICYKPTINKCGHIFCFWCMHKAMSGITNSNCPLCRQEYAHFPTVCAALHRYLQLMFPEDYTRKGQLVKEQEEIDGVESAAVVDCKDAQDLWKGFACANCYQLARDPRVLACGHFICPNCDVPDACPHCKLLVRSYASSSRQIRDLVGDLFPGSATQPFSTTAREQTGPSMRKSDPSAPMGIDASAQGADFAATTSENANITSEAGGVPEPTSTHEAGIGSSSRSNPAQESTAQSGLRDCPEAGGAPEQDVVEEFLHAGVGCDGCGESPIQGRRYRCLDCPEAIGFDLCQHCYQHSQTQPLVRGRFNQTHTSDHRMELVTFRRALRGQTMFATLMEQSLQYWALHGPHEFGTLLVDAARQVQPGQGDEPQDPVAMDSSTGERAIGAIADLPSHLRRMPGQASEPPDPDARDGSAGDPTAGGAGAGDPDADLPPHLRHLRG